MSTTTERPILFNGDMVKAILEGRKTQTRRIIRDCPAGAYGAHDVGWLCGSGKRLYVKHQEQTLCWPGEMESVKSPYGDKGDILWVRESIKAIEHDDGRDVIAYLADGHECFPFENPQWIVTGKQRVCS